MLIVKVKYSIYKKKTLVKCKETIISSSSEEVIDSLELMGAKDIKVTSVKPLISFF